MNFQIQLFCLICYGYFQCMLSLFLGRFSPLRIQKQKIGQYNYLDTCFDGEVSWILHCLIQLPSQIWQKISGIHVGFCAFSQKFQQCLMAFVWVLDWCYGFRWFSYKLIQSQPLNNKDYRSFIFILNMKIFLEKCNLSQCIEVRSSRQLNCSFFIHW